MNQPSPVSRYPFEDLLLGMVYALDIYQKSLVVGAKCSAAYLMYPTLDNVVQWRRMFEVMRDIRDHDDWSLSQITYALSCNTELLGKRLAEISTEYFIIYRDMIPSKMQIVDKGTITMSAESITRGHYFSLYAMCRAILLYEAGDIPRIFILKRQDQ